MKVSLGAAASVVPASDQASLEHHYLASIRQRFKAEVNRMTGGAMRQLLAHRPDADLLSFPLSYLYAYHWLRREVPDSAYRRAVLSTFKGSKRAFLMDLLVDSSDARGFLRGYIESLRSNESDTSVQRLQLLELLTQESNNPESLTTRLLDVCEGLGLLCDSYAVAYRNLGREERERYGGMLGPVDLERLALVDAMPDSGAGDGRFELSVRPATRRSSFVCCTSRTP